MPYIGKEAIVHNIDSSGGSERSLLKAHDNPVSEYVKSVQHVLEQISCVLALESVVTHHELGYTGTFDCVVKYRFVPFNYCSVHVVVLCIILYR